MIWWVIKLIENKILRKSNITKITRFQQNFHPNFHPIETLISDIHYIHYIYIYWYYKFLQDTGHVVTIEFCDVGRPAKSFWCRSTWIRLYYFHVGGALDEYNGCALQRGYLIVWSFVIQNITCVYIYIQDVRLDRFIVRIIIDVLVSMVIILLDHRGSSFLITVQYLPEQIA